MAPAAGENWQRRGAVKRVAATTGVAERGRHGVASGEKEHLSGSTAARRRVWREDGGVNGILRRGILNAGDVNLWRRTSARLSAWI